MFSNADPPIDLTYVLERISPPKQLGLLRALKNLSTLSVAVENWHKLNTCRLFAHFLSYSNGHFGKVIYIPVVESIEFETIHVSKS
jgi:hypothetical protein